VGGGGGGGAGSCQLKIRPASGGDQGLLTAPRGVNPGPVASTGPVEHFFWVASDAALAFLSLAIGPLADGAHIGCYSGDVRRSAVDFLLDQPRSPAQWLKRALPWGPSPCQPKRPPAFRSTGPTKGLFSPICFGPGQVRSDFFSGSREATTPRTIFFIGAGERNTTCGFFLRRARKHPRTACDFFLGNTGAQPGGGRRPQTGLP
jgi:hypothetical protein